MTTAAKKKVDAGSNFRPPVARLTTTGGPGYPQGGRVPLGDTNPRPGATRLPAGVRYQPPGSRDRLPSSPSPAMDGARLRTLYVNGRLVSPPVSAGRGPGLPGTVFQNNAQPAGFGRAPAAFRSPLAPLAALPPLAPLAPLPPTPQRLPMQLPLMQPLSLLTSLSLGTQDPLADATDAVTDDLVTAEQNLAQAQADQSAAQDAEQNAEKAKDDADKQVQAAILNFMFGPTPVTFQQLLDALNNDAQKQKDLADARDKLDKANKAERDAAVQAARAEQAAQDALAQSLANAGTGSNGFNGGGDGGGSSGGGGSDGSGGSGGFAGGDGSGSGSGSSLGGDSSDPGATAPGVAQTAPAPVTPAPAADSGAQDPVSDPSQDQLQDQRYLKVSNNMGSPLTLSLQLYTKNDQGAWTWVGGQRMSYRLAAGQTTYLGMQGQKLAGSKIRFVARWQGGEFTQYRDRDLWLVPEVDGAGNHVYSAAEMDTYPLDLRP